MRLLALLTLIISAVSGLENLNLTQEQLDRESPDVDSDSTDDDKESSWTN